MPDPTPTPDTLRAAIDSLGESARAGLALSPARQVVLRGLLIDAYAARAALAASPAPTDSPDERVDDVHAIQRTPRPAATPPNHGEWLPDAGTYEDGTTEEQRRDEVRATTCRRLGHHWLSDGTCDRCGDPRPAAVTAPREDERTAALRCPACWARPGEPCRHEQTGAGLTWFHSARSAAAVPAVERATDTLTALISDLLVNPATWTGAVPSRDLARALIAAGVTLNQTGPGA